MQTSLISRSLYYRSFGLIHLCVARKMSSDAPGSLQSYPARISELSESLERIRQRVRNASASRGDNERNQSPVLVAVSKYKPASDILACYEQGQRDFGENYVQELVDKAQQLPHDVRWHFIGTLQSNKAKTLASIANLYSLQTIGSIKGADALNRSLSPDRDANPLRVFLQVNTSGEDSKSGLPPFQSSRRDENTDQEHPAETDTELYKLSVHIIDNCARLRLLGLMTIGSISESHSDKGTNLDFECLKQTRNRLEELLRAREASGTSTWGQDSKLLLSMGMSSDFEQALRAGSDYVRVGTGIFGERPKKSDA